MGEEIINGNKHIIINSGPHPDDFEIKDWTHAKKIEDEFNKTNKNKNMKWSFDCGFKLDYDEDGQGAFKISSRFYPPAKYYGPGWDGHVSIWYGHSYLFDKKFLCNSLKELKKEVEEFVLKLNILLNKKIKKMIKEIKRVI